MTVKWKKGFDPSVIIEKFLEIRNLEDEQVSFSGFEYNDYIAVLQSMIIIHDNIPTEESQNLIVTGLHQAAKKKSLIAQMFYQKLIKQQELILPFQIKTII